MTEKAMIHSPKYPKMTDPTIVPTENMMSKVLDFLDALSVMDVLRLWYKLDAVTSGVMPWSIASTINGTMGTECKLSCFGKGSFSTHWDNGAVRSYLLMVIKCSKCVIKDHYICEYGQ